MPPRKTKKPTMEIKETPIIFFLKINENQDTICPVGEKVSYSDILSQTFIENTTEERFSNDILKPLLENIHKEKEYSRTTSCFWCCHGFSTTAFVLPITYDTYKNVFICEGHYCSPECALAFLYTDYAISDSSRWYRHSLLIQLYGFLYEQYIISPAPPKTLLRMFGGPLDIKQYRNYLKNTNDLILSKLPPIRMYFPSMNIQGPLRDFKKYVSLSNEVLDKASESLRLKRTKPLQTNIPTLDMCIKH
jgi:hypothetical protein